MLTKNKGRIKKTLKTSPNTKNKKPRKRQVATNTKKTTIMTPDRLHRKVETHSFKLGRRHHSSPAVAFTRLKFNRPYKPGD